MSHGEAALEDELADCVAPIESVVANSFPLASFLPPQIGQVSSSFRKCSFEGCTDWAGTTISYDDTILSGGVCARHGAEVVVEAYKRGRGISENAVVGCTNTIREEEVGTRKDCWHVRRNSRRPRRRSWNKRRKLLR